MNRRCPGKSGATVLNVTGGTVDFVIGTAEFDSPVLGMCWSLFFLNPAAQRGVMPRVKRSSANSESTSIYNSDGCRGYSMSKFWLEILWENHFQNPLKKAQNSVKMNSVFFRNYCVLVMDLNKVFRRGKVAASLILPLCGVFVHRNSKQSPDSPKFVLNFKEIVARGFRPLFFQQLAPYGSKVHNQQFFYIRLRFCGNIRI